MVHFSEDESALLGGRRAGVRGAGEGSILQAAIGFAAGLPEVGPARIATWGFSFSGGHAELSFLRRHLLEQSRAHAPATAGSAPQGGGRA